MMANIEVKKVEEQLNHRLLYSVRVSGDADHMEFPIGIPDQGTPAANEAAVLASALAFAEALEAAAQLRLGAGTHR
jgi:hypothetical protein